MTDIGNKANVLQNAKNLNNKGIKGGYEACSRPNEAESHDQSGQIVRCDQR